MPVLAQTKPQPPCRGPTRGEVDVGKQDDVGGHKGDELSDANLLLEVHVDQALCPKAAVGAGVQEHQAGPQAAQKPGHGVGSGRWTVPLGPGDKDNP